jgi:hypothetical protein
MIVTSQAGIAAFVSMTSPSDIPGKFHAEISTCGVIADQMKRIAIARSQDVRLRVNMFNGRIRMLAMGETITRNPLKKSDAVRNSFHDPVIITAGMNCVRKKREAVIMAYFFRM